MKHTLLFMSLITFLFGCGGKKTSADASAKTEAWPRFPATDNPSVQVEPVRLEGDFGLRAFFIAPDKQSVYVLGVRNSQHGNQREGGEPRPGPPDQVNYRLYCLDAMGQVKKQVDMLRTDWIGGGSFGLLEGQLMLRVGDWLLVLDPVKLTILEKIPVHESIYIPWKQTVLMPDEHRADYQKKFDALYEKPGTKWLYWTASGEHWVFVQGAAGKRSAWPPMDYEDELLADLEKRFPPLQVSLNPTAFSPDSTQVSDGAAAIREAELRSDGTQLDYPNYRNRSVLQYEMTLGDKKARFSTTDRDQHSLRVGYSDNMMLTTADGAVWVSFEGVIYRVK